MPNYRQQHKSEKVDATAGVPGILRVVKSILGLSRVQEITINKDEVKYWRWALPDEPDQAVTIEFTDLMPYAIVRNSVLTELNPCSDNAAIVVGQMFAAVCQAGLNPIGFVCNPDSKFWAWHAKTTGVVMGNSELYGLPCYKDQGIPSETLILCAGYERRSLLTDTVSSYKITIPLGGAR